MANTRDEVNGQFPELELIQRFHSTPNEMEKLVKLIESKQEVGVVINACYGGFRLSPQGMQRYAELSGNPVPTCKYYTDYVRHDPILVKVVQELGADSHSKYSELYVDTVPFHLLLYYSLDEYDGVENIRPHEHEFKQFIIGKIAHSVFTDGDDGDSKEMLLKKMEMIRYIHSC